jgi:hypothetical protein
LDSPVASEYYRPARVPSPEPRPPSEQPLAKSHNVNVAFQRDIGFNTVAEIAWVGNYTWNHGRFVDDNRLPVYVFGNPNNLVNNAPIASNSLRYQYGKYPGWAP